MTTSGGQPLSAVQQRIMAHGPVETDPVVCRGIAEGLFSPTTREECAPELPRDGALVRGGKRGLDVTLPPAQRTKSRPATAQRDPAIAPLADDLERMDMAPLRALASGCRCVEKAGVGALRKAELVSLLQGITAMVDNLPIKEDRLIFRESTIDETPQERLQRHMAGTPDESSWKSDHLKLRGKLPELSESVIIDDVSAGGRCLAMRRHGTCIAECSVLWIWVDWTDFLQCYLLTPRVCSG